MDISILNIKSLVKGKEEQNTKKIKQFFIFFYIKIIYSSTKAEYIVQIVLLAGFAGLVLFNNSIKKLFLVQTFFFRSFVNAKTTISIKKKSGQSVRRKMYTKFCVDSHINI